MKLDNLFEQFCLRLFKSIKFQRQVNIINKGYDYNGYDKI